MTWVSALLPRPAATDWMRTQPAGALTVKMSTSVDSLNVPQTQVSISMDSGVTMVCGSTSGCAQGGGGPVSTGLVSIGGEVSSGTLVSVGPVSIWLLFDGSPPG